MDDEKRGRKTHRWNAGTSRTRGRVPMANWREKNLARLIVTGSISFVIFVYPRPLRNSFDAWKIKR